MNIFFNQTSKFSLAMLLLLSMVFLGVGFGISAQDAQAQNNRQTFLCVNRQALRNNLQKAYLENGDPQCPSGWDPYSDLTSARGLCISSQTIPVVTFSPNESGVTLDQDGKCIKVINDDEELEYDFRTFTSITAQYNPNTGGGGSGGGTGTGDTDPPGGGGGSGSSGGPGGSSGGTTTQVQGDCEANFHKVGPLCVPNSPFTNSSAPINEQTAAGLAIKIIRILLYFAGIVAVIMMIIGGYQVMTAAGNESQATNGRKTLTNAIIGLAIVILSYIIIQALNNFLTK